LALASAGSAAQAQSLPTTAPAQGPQTSATRPAAAAAASPGGSAELLAFEDIPVVVSASRQARPASLSTVPVSVVTAQDIHYSGLTNIPEILQFVPGVNVLRFDRNHYAVGVRGLHDSFSDRTLVMIDGRPVNNPGFGGVEWDRIPVAIEDIDRIEVVRGPAGSAWGANAFNGVINIITKDPQGTQGGFVSSTASWFGDTYNHVRYGGSDGKWNYRMSGVFSNLVSSDDAAWHKDVDAGDHANDWTGTFDATYALTDRTRVALGLAHSYRQEGAFEMMGYLPPGQAWLDTTRTYVKVDTKIDQDTSASLQWFGNFDNAHEPSYLDRFWNVDTGVEGQYNFRPSRDHHASVGGNLRWTDSEFLSDPPYDFRMEGTPFQEFWAGAFGMDRWQATDRLEIDSELRMDWYSGTQVDWSGRLTGLYALDQEKAHILRLSVAKAFRAPSSGLRTNEVTRIPLPSPPLPPDLFGFNLLRPDAHMRNEETWSVEAGYTGQLTKNLSLRSDVFFQRYEDMIGAQVQPDPLGIGRRIVKMANGQGASALGSETELALTGKAGKLSAWYTFDHFVPDQADPAFRAYLPSEHNVGVTGRLDLSADWHLTSSYRFTSVTPHDVNSLADAPASHRWDVGVTRDFHLGKSTGEIMVGVSDILNTTDDPVYSVGAKTYHLTPGRTLFLRLQWKF
jgi:iron complex outermembrane receptor protein